MEVLILRRFVSVIIQLIAYSTAIDYDEGCFLDEPASLQVAFVMDRTGTFFNGAGNSFLLNLLH